MPLNTSLAFAAICCVGICAAVPPDQTQELSLLLESIRKKPRDASLLLRLSQEYSALKRDSDVVETLSRLVDSLRYEQASQPLISASLQLLEPIHLRDPKAFRTSYVYAEMLFLGRQYNRALNVLSGIGAQGGSNPDFLNLAAMCFAGVNDLPKASQALLRAIDLAPDRVDLLVNLAGLYQRAKNNQAAVMALERAAQMPSATATVFFTLALSRFNLGEFAGTIEDCKKAIGLDPQFDKALLLMGRAYVKLGKPDDAARALRRASVLNSACYQCRIELAVLLADSGEIVEAARRLREALAISPNNAEAHYQLAGLLTKQDRVGEAVAELQKAVSSNPEHDGAHYQLAMLYRKQGRTDEADRLFKALQERKEKRRAASQADLSRKQAEVSTTK